MPKSKKKSRDKVDKNANRDEESNSLDYVRRFTMATGMPNYKIILCGEYGVGKSSLFRRFMNNTFTMEVKPQGKKSTIGLDQANQTFMVGGEEVRVCRKHETW